MKMGIKLDVCFKLTVLVFFLTKFSTVYTQNNGDGNNHKPLFMDCANYKPEVEEEKKDEFVIKVNAEDKDPPANGGTVTYNIIQKEGERAQFRINQATGEIFTLIAFDRDEPMRHKEIYLSVQATDNGKPKLSDICTFKVTIKDINDNAPVFDQSSYETGASEDLKERSEVMRLFAYDLDDGENARLSYKIQDTNNDFSRFFRIDEDTGVVYLNEPLHGQVGRKFTTTVTVTDHGYQAQESFATVSISVVGSDKKTPSIEADKTDIKIRESFNKFDRVPENALVTIRAQSNIADKNVVFELVRGKTIQTNKEQTFILTPVGADAIITLTRMLDYELVSQYQLTVRVTNKDQLTASININVEVEDVNDETPAFIELLTGSIVEEDDTESPQAMQVRAIDKDGTSPNNVVQYVLMDQQDNFAIDRNTGIITAKRKFDREQNKIYNVKVKAYDSAPSALYSTNEPNSAEQVFQIKIEDINDNKPVFMQATYEVFNISESRDLKTLVLEVKAVDPDDASTLKYSIISGNIDDSFKIEENTGRIIVKNKLDYEKIEDYNLTVMAFDGKYNDTAEVYIHIMNENDELPVYEPYDKNVYVLEEQIPDNCIVTLSAYDPDIKDRNADQHIVFKVRDEDKSFLSVSKDGCVKLIKPLDRDKPNGNPTWQAFIEARDQDERRGFLSQHAEININLGDINDNAPYLTSTEIVWMENQPQDHITTLTAADNDGPDNGPPFRYAMASTNPSILEKFAISYDGELSALAMFDREVAKYYDIELDITDSPRGNPMQEPKTGRSVLRVIIGDVNDCEAKDGTSEIFVNKYELLANDIKIGRVYVDDLDDWDLPDKTFSPKVHYDYFYLDQSDTGMIMMRKETPPGNHTLSFDVVERIEGREHTVTGDVTVAVKLIPEEAVENSGSIRFPKAQLGIDMLVDRDSGLSRIDTFQNEIAKVVNTSVHNVDIVSILVPPTNDSFIDVRFAAHGSPYYAPERLNNIIVDEQRHFERIFGSKIFMVGINECVFEGACPNKTSCSSILEIDDAEPAVVFTNRTSYVGVKAVVKKICECVPDEVICTNNGTLINGECVCPSGVDGPRCENVCVGFSTPGYAMYPTFNVCNYTTISLTLTTTQKDALVFYIGPRTLSEAEISKDFMALELREGYPRLTVDVAGEPLMIPYNKTRVNDGSPHRVHIKMGSITKVVEIIVGDCGSECLVYADLPTASMLKVYEPLQIGGMKSLISSEDFKHGWGLAPPLSSGFIGTIANFTYNEQLYNLGVPADGLRYASCELVGLTQAVTFGIDSNFLVAILVCIAILIILLLAVVVHRKQHDPFNEKDMDDTRENIINYEDEGGGECDANFDLSVLCANPDEKLPIRDMQGEVPADISGFLDGKKHGCDKDPDNQPYDDVRYYAYEGDGNSSGSLSSLASCTDENDLKFNYLSNFGPRFRKLADMYGEEDSDNDSQDGGSESWC